MSERRKDDADPDATVMLPAGGSKAHAPDEDATVMIPASRRAYLSLYDGPKADPKQIEAAARRVWRLPDAESAALLAHLRAGLEGGSPEMRHPRDEAIIREARQKQAPPKRT